MGVLLLAEVALGKEWEKYDADYNANLVSRGRAAPLPTTERFARSATARHAKHQGSWQVPAGSQRCARGAHSPSHRHNCPADCAGAAASLRPQAAM